MNYLDILSQIDKDYLGLSRTEIIKKLELPSNNIKLINDVKNFIFENGFSLDINVICSYLMYKIDKNMIVENNLLEQYLKIFNKTDILNNTNCSNYYFRYEDLNTICYDFDIYNWPHSNIKKTFCNGQIPTYIKILQTIIYFVLSKTKIIDLSKIKDIDISMIKKSYNNFFVQTKKINILENKYIHYNNTRYNNTLYNNKRCNNINSNKLIYNISKNKNVLIFLDNLANNTNSVETNIRNEYNNLSEITIYEKKSSVYNTIFYNNGINVVCFSSPYKKKEIEAFKVDYQYLTNINTKFDINNTILFFKLCQKYTEFTKNVLETKENTNINLCQDNQLIFKVEDNKIYRYYFNCYDREQNNNYLISYNFINNFITNNFNQNIYTNNEYSKAKTAIEKIVSCKKNKCFIVLDLTKAFYNTRLSNIINIIKLNFKEETHKELYMYLNILFDFYQTIQNDYFKSYYKTSKMYDHLPITHFSHILFKLYLICLFKNTGVDKTFVSYVDDFIIYGNHDNIFKRFDNFYDIISKHYVISSLKIYDKLFHNKLNIIKTDFNFNTTIEDEIEMFKSTNTDVDNITIKMKLEMSLEEQQINSNKLSQTVIDIVSPEQLLNLFNMIPNNEKKKISSFEKEENICKVCLVNKQTHVLDNCGHVFCYRCLNHIQNKLCPCCKTKFGKFIKLYNI